MPSEILIREKISSLVNEAAPPDTVREAIETLFANEDEKTDVDFLKSIIKELLVHSTAKEKAEECDTKVHDDGSNSTSLDRPLPSKMTDIILSQLSGQRSPLRNRTKKLLIRQIEKHKNDTLAAEYTNSGDSGFEENHSSTSKRHKSSKSKKGSSKLHFAENVTSPLTYGTHINASKKKTSISYNTSSGKVKTLHSIGKIAGAPDEVKDSSDDDLPQFMNRNYKHQGNRNGQSNYEDVGTDTGTINTTNAVSGKQHGKNSSNKHSSRKEGSGSSKIRQQFHIPRPKTYESTRNSQKQSAKNKGNFDEQNAGSDSSFIDTDGIGGDADIEDYRPSRKNKNSNTTTNGYEGENDNGEGDDTLTPSSSAVELNMQMPSSTTGTAGATGADGMNVGNTGNGIANTSTSTRIRASRLGTVSLPTLQELGLRNGLPTEEFYPPDAPKQGKDSDNGDNIDDIQLKTNPANLSLYNNMSDENLSISNGDDDDDQEALSNCSDVPSQSSGDGDDQIYDDEMYAQAIAGWRQVLPLEKSSSDQNLMEYQLKKNYNLTHHDFLKGILDDIDTLAEQPSPVSSGKPSPEVIKSSKKDTPYEEDIQESASESMQFSTQVVYPNDSSSDSSSDVEIEGQEPAPTESAVRFMGAASDLIDDNMQRRVMRMMTGGSKTHTGINASETGTLMSPERESGRIVFNSTNIHTTYPSMSVKSRSSRSNSYNDSNDKSVGERNESDSDESKRELERKIKELEDHHLANHGGLSSNTSTPAKDYTSRKRIQKDMTDRKLTSLELVVDTDDEIMKGELSGYRRRHFAHEKPTAASQNRRRPKLVDERKESSNNGSARSPRSSKRSIPSETLSSPTYRPGSVPLSNSSGSGARSPGSPYKIDANAPDTYVNSLSRILAGQEHTVALKRAYAAKRGTKQVFNSSRDVVTRLAESVMNLESIGGIKGKQASKTYTKQTVPGQEKEKKLSIERGARERARVTRPSTSLITPPDTVERYKNSRLQQVAEAAQAIQSGYNRDESFGVYDNEMRWKRYLATTNEGAEQPVELELSSLNISNTSTNIDVSASLGGMEDTPLYNIDEVLAEFERNVQEKFTDLMDIPEEGIPVDTQVLKRATSLQGDTDSMTRQSVESAISLSKFIEKHHAIDHFGENYDSIDSSTANALSIDDRAGKPSYGDLPVDNDDHLDPASHMGGEGVDACFRDRYNKILQQYSSEVREKINGSSPPDAGATTTGEAAVDDDSGDDVLHPSMNVRVTPDKLRGSIDVSGHNDQSGHHSHSKKIGIIDRLPSTHHPSVSASLESGDIEIMDKHAHYQELHQANHELMNCKSNRYEYTDDIDNDGNHGDDEEYEEVLRGSNNNNIIAFSIDNGTGVLRFPEFDEVDGDDAELHRSKSSNSKKSSPTSGTRRSQLQNSYMSNASTTNNSNTHKRNGEHKGNTKVLKEKYKITVFTEKGEFDPIAFFPKTVAGGTSYGPPKYTTTRSKGKGKSKTSVKSKVIDNRNSHASLEAAVRETNDHMGMLDDSVMSESSRVRQATSELSSPTFKRTAEAALETLNETNKIEFAVRETRKKNHKALKLKKKQ